VSARAIPAESPNAVAPPRAALHKTPALSGDRRYTESPRRNKVSTRLPALRAATDCGTGEPPGTRSVGASLGEHATAALRIDASNSRRDMVTAL
jgi:hypothetical protein